MTADYVTVDKPRHSMYALTTAELSAYRRQLESAIAFFDEQTPVPPVRAELQVALDGVLGRVL